MAYTEQQMLKACILNPANVTGAATSGGALAPTPVRRIESQNLEAIHAVRGITHNDAAYIIVGTEAGMQVWDRNAVHLLHTWLFPSMDPAPDAITALFVQGIAINRAADGSVNLCFGDSTGTLRVIEFCLEAAAKFQAPREFRHHRSPITCMGSAYQSRQGMWTPQLGHKLVTCDEAGQISIWDAASSSQYSVVHSITSSSAPVTSVAVRNDSIIAARLDGKVQIYALATGMIEAEIVAHSRWLVAMDIHPLKDIIATVSEDATVNVWTLPFNGQKVTNLLSSLWMHAALTGVCFCGPHFDDVAVVAYDTDELHIYKPSKPT